MGYVFFVLTSAILMIRPAEINFAAFGYPFYEFFIIGSLICSFQFITPQFESRDLEKNPLSVCILWVLVFNTLSNICNFQFDEVIDNASEFAKLLIYYFLLLGLLDTPKRVVSYIRWLTFFAGISNLVAVLYLHRYIQIDQANLVTDMDGTAVERMGGTGLFKDPNDLAVLVASFMPFCVFLAIRKGTPFLARMFWLGLLGFFFYGILQTQSRGGLLAVGAGVGGYALARFGRKGILLLGLVPVMMLGVGGRQADISLSSGTGQGRIQLQHEGFSQYIRRPLFGMGLEHFADIGGHVAHNSYVQAMTETGFIGGALFTSCYVYSMLTLIKMGKNRRVLDPDMNALRPYLIAVLSIQMVAKMSLSQTVIIPTFMFMGFSAVFSRVAETDPPFDMRYLVKSGFWPTVITVGVCQSIFFFVYLNVMVRF